MMYGHKLQATRCRNELAQLLHELVPVDEVVGVDVSLPTSRGRDVYG